MYIYVINRDFEKIGMIENASVIWASRYYSCGDFEIYMPATKKNIDLIKQGYFVIKEDKETKKIDKDNVGILEDLELSDEIEEGDMVTITGKFAPVILGKRIIAQQTQLRGNFQTSVRNLITTNVINPVKSSRKISCIELGNLDDSITETLEMQTTGDNLLTKIEETSKNLGIGFRMPLRKKKIYFEMFKGIDRSYNQSQNPWIVFSDKYDNLSSSLYQKTTSIKKNVFLIASEGEGLDRKTLWGSANDDEDSITDLDRIETYVDARNMSSNEDNITDDEFYNQMNEEGKTHLVVTSESFDGTILLKNYKYGKPEDGGDFFLGDIITIEKNKWGLYINARVIEHIDSCDQNGKVETITLEI